jgi:hypothetical protein
MEEVETLLWGWFIYLKDLIALAPDYKMISAYY